MTREQLTGYNLIELRIILQRAIELMDELDIVKYPFRNKSLQSQLKGLYPSLDKETQKYNAMFEITEEGTTAFYDTVCENARQMMNYNLIDKIGVARYLMALEKNEKAINGITDKILKNGR